MDLLNKIFFPGIPYPQAIIWHIILGGLVAGVFGAIAFGYRGNGYALPIIGALVFLVFGFLTYRFKKQIR